MYSSYKLHILHLSCPKSDYLREAHARRRSLLHGSSLQSYSTILDYPHLKLIVYWYIHMIVFTGIDQCTVYFSK